MSDNGTSRTEYLSLEVIGGSREAALDRADAMAVDYFATTDAGRLQRTIGRAEPMPTLDGRVLFWRINIEYREQP